jgi:uncharacterized protein YciI
VAQALLAFDGTDDAAPARRAAARERHVALNAAMAADGRLLLGVPLRRPDGASAGSLMLLAGDDRAIADAYLAEEPFAREGVWQRIDLHPFRVAPLPYRPLAEAASSAARSHTVIIAWDGRDEGALERRMAVREAHLARAARAAADGTLTLGGALLDAPGGHMIGSIVVIAAARDEAAAAWMASDPYVTGGVWRDITLWGTRLAPLPYRLLPGSG